MASVLPGPARSLVASCLLLANLLVANAAAAMAVAAFLRPGLFTRPGMTIEPSETSERLLVVPLETPWSWGVFFGAVALLLWNFAWLVRRPERRLPVHWVTSDTPSGPVRVAREALEVGLRAAGEALPEITRLRVVVDTSSAKRIVVTGLFQCAEGTNNLSASQRLRQTLLERFGEMVRPTDGTKVEVELEFQGFLGKLDKKAASDLPPAEDGQPFTGPKYPIDDDSLGEAH